MEGSQKPVSKYAPPQFLSSNLIQLKSPKKKVPGPSASNLFSQLVSPKDQESSKRIKVNLLADFGKNNLVTPEKAVEVTPDPNGLASFTEALHSVSFVQNKGLN